MASFDDSLRMIPDQRKIFRFRMDSKDDVDALYYRVTSNISDTGKVTMYDIAKYFNSFNPEEKIELSKDLKNIEWSSSSPIFIFPNTTTLWAIEHHMNNSNN